MDGVKVNMAMKGANVRMYTMMEMIEPTTALSMEIAIKNLEMPIVIMTFIFRLKSKLTNRLECLKMKWPRSKK